MKARIFRGLFSVCETRRNVPFVRRIVAFLTCETEQGKKNGEFYFPLSFTHEKKKHCPDNIWIRLPPIHFVRISACFLKA